jgi:hypothetical protein
LPTIGIFLTVLIRPLWRIGGALAAMLLRVIPRRHRYAAAARLSGVLAPLIARSSAGRIRWAMGFDTYREIALDLILIMADRHRVRYDPDIRAEPRAILDEALNSGAPVLIVTVHTMLSTAIIRYLHDRGVPLGLASATPMPIGGTGLEGDLLGVGTAVLLRMQRRLRNGGVVSAMIDRGDENEPNLIPFETARRRQHLSPTAIRLGLRRRARILFFTGGYDEASRAIVLSFGAPAAASAGSVEAIANDFIAFVQAHVASRAGTP